MKNRILFLLTVFIALQSCKHDIANTPTPVVPIIALPSALTYSPQILEIVAGQAATSVKPTLQGDAPFTFSLTTSPITNGLTISNDGIITIPANLPENTYKITVFVKNAVGTKTFTDIYTVVVKPATPAGVAPSALAYSPNNLVLTQGIGGNSTIPTIKGTSPITYSITTNPSNNGITINNNTGMISVATTVVAGNYIATITANNGVANAVVFQNAFTITVNPLSTSKTTFEGDVKTILANNGCINCHAELAAYTVSKSRINLILSRIQLASNQAGFMPQGGNKMSDAQINTIKKWLSDGLLEK
jgi:hypothetical protein